MNRDEILSAAGAARPRKRIGRGTGSGHGKTSGRGNKGFGARAGNSRRLGYEGGQNPVLARIPKRGFNNYNFRTEYQIVNVEDLNAFDDGTRVDAQALAQAGLAQAGNGAIKVLGKGDLGKKLTVVAAKFSGAAAQKITAAGGSTEQA